MFDAMVDSIREDTVRMLLTVRLQKNQAPEREQVPSRTHRMQAQVTAALAHSAAAQRRSKYSFCDLNDSKNGGHGFRCVPLFFTEEVQPCRKQAMKHFRSIMMH